MARFSWLLNDSSSPLFVKFETFETTGFVCNFIVHLQANEVGKIARKLRTSSSIGSQ